MKITLIKMKVSTILILLIPIFVSSQDLSMDDIINDFCERVEKLEWDNNSDEDIIEIISLLSYEVKHDNLETINQIIERFKEDNPELTDEEIEKKFAIKHAEALAINCESYLILLRNLLPQCPTENETLLLINSRIDSVLIQNENLPFPDQIDLVDKYLLKFIADNKSLISKDYNSVTSEVELADNIKIYLQYNCIKYLRANSVSEIQKGCE